MAIQSFYNVRIRVYKRTLEDILSKHNHLDVGNVGLQLLYTVPIFGINLL